MCRGLYEASEDSRVKVRTAGGERVVMDAIMIEHKIGGMLDHDLVVENL